MNLKFCNKFHRGSYLDTYIYLLQTFPRLESELIVTKKATLGLTYTRETMSLFGYFFIMFLL